MLFSFSGCGLAISTFFATIFARESPTKDPDNYPQYPNYQSAYTEEEHVQKLTEMTTESLIWKTITGDYFRAYVGLRAVEVEIVYAFHDYDPEFFVIDFTFENKAVVAGYDGEPTDKAYFLGYILNDEYYLLHYGGGENPWSVAGYQDYKKYFGSGYYAVKIDGKMTAFFRQYYSTDGFGTTRKEENIHEELSANTEKDYMEYDYRNDLTVKYEIKHVDYEDKYFPHRGLISKKTERRFKEEKFYEFGYSGAISLKSYTIETVYSIYDNDPEYFLVQIDLKEKIEVGVYEKIPTDKLWYILLFQNDEYYIWDCGYGLNLYAASGFGDSVKYHALGHYAVQTGENELTEIIQNAETGVWEQHVLTDAEKRIYGQYNDVYDCDLYYKE